MIPREHVIEQTHYTSPQPISQSRPTSVTLIPRPVSGTYRNASSKLVSLSDQHTVLRPGTDRIASSLRDKTAVGPPYKSHRSNNGMPPCSFPAPRTLLSQIDSTMVYTAPLRRKSITSEHKVNDSTSSQRISSLIGTNALSSPASGLDKSKNGKIHNNFAQGKREITPRTLMKPIQPALPRSQTVGQLQCFSGTSSTSPTKAPRHSSFAHIYDNQDTSRQDVLGPRLDAGMSKDELNRLNQKRILDNAEGSRLTRGPSKNLPAFNSIVHSSSASCKNVYQAEDIAYWTGRYVAASDRIRQNDCDSILKPENLRRPPLSVNDFDIQFDRLESTRSHRVIDELRQYCKTPSAIQSFDRFETQLKNPTDFPSKLFVRSCSEVSPGTNRVNNPKRVPQNEITGLREYSGNNTTSQLSIFHAQATIGKLADVMSKKGGLPKSKTTGNLALKSASQRVPTPGVLSTPPSTANDSAAMIVSESRARAIEEREARSGDKCKKFQGLSGSSKVMSHLKHDRQNVDYEQSLSSALPTQTPVIRDVRARKAASEALVASDLTISALKIGYDAPPTLNPRRRVDAVHDVVEKETEKPILYQKKSKPYRSDGQNSGEFVKKVVGAGIREVRKMSRRVGSIG